MKKKELNSGKLMFHRGKVDTLEELVEWLEDDQNYDYNIVGDVTYVSSLDLMEKLKELEGGD